PVLIDASSQRLYFAQLSDEEIVHNLGRSFRYCALLAATNFHHHQSSDNLSSFDQK
ncbi:hypothetical protein D018_2328B, partial [Vibrio parahaemolyticus VP2007-007]